MHISTRLAAIALLLPANACSLSTEDAARSADERLASFESAPSEQEPAPSTGGSPQPEEREEAPAPAPTWHFELRPYLWVPAMHGDVTVRGTRVDVGLNQSESFNMLNELEGAFVLHGELGLGRLSLFADLFYMMLDETQPTRTGNVEFELAQSIAELGAAFEVLNEPLGEGLALRVAPLGGARFYVIDQQLSSSSFGRRSDEKAWVDGFLGLRFRAGEDEGLALVGRFDAGAGGSDAAWNALVAIEWNIASFLGLEMGYRWLSIDYETGSGAQRFGYDMLLLGPYFGLSFRF